MTRNEAIDEYIKYIQDETYEISEEAIKLLGLDDTTMIMPTATSEGSLVTKIPMFDVTNFNLSDEDGSYYEGSLLSFNFGNSVYQTIENMPMLLRKTTYQNAKYPTNGRDLYAGPVSNLNSLSKYPITNAVNNRGYWIDYQGNPNSSQIVSLVIYMDNTRTPHLCTIGYDTSYQPVDGWKDLTETGSLAIDYHMYHDESADLAMNENGINAVVSYLSSSALNATTGVTVTDSSTNYDQTAFITTSFQFDLTAIDSSSDLYKIVSTLQNYTQGDPNGHANLIRSLMLSSNTTPFYYPSSGFVTLTTTENGIRIEIEMTCECNTTTDAEALANAAKAKYMYYYLNSYNLIRKS